MVFINTSGLSGDRRLAAKLQSLESTLGFLENRQKVFPASAEEGFWLEQLRGRLKLAKSLLDKPHKQSLFSDDPTLRELIHGMDADMLLLLPTDLLAAEALKLEEQFRRNIQESSVRAAWLGPDEKSGLLCQAVQQLVRLFVQSPLLTPDEGLSLRHVRLILQGALRVVSEHADLHDRQFAFTTLLRSSSGGLLLLLFFLAWAFELPMRFAELLGDDTPLSSGLGFLALALIGAGGAIAGNMFSDEPPLALSKSGVQEFVYYLFVRPSLGAFAAFLFYLLAQSGFLISIESTAGGSSAGPQSAIRVMVGDAPQAKACAYALIAIAVGFSAEKLLGPMMDKVLGRLFSQLERTQPASGALSEKSPSCPPALTGRAGPASGPA